MDEAVGAWLLGATESRDRSRTEWQDLGVTMLPTGRIFSAIRMSARLVHAAACTTDLAAVDHYLARALVGGPAIHDPHRCRYYVLMSADSGRPWEYTRDVEPRGLGSYVGVPRPGRNAPDDSGAPYWSVSMEAAGALCAPSVVAALVEIGLHELAGRTPGAGGQVFPLPTKGSR
ncbi:hypothetical protein PV735_05200 [Streptomyces turgidiscabies]|uniref:hypothetical protein n=1 Tax=Streptomyces turgidiscabies TaxID=85558 RepID=UPI0003023372|nr:hypothetical protein [Streptomyces turgidiscabies]MDX3492085.1 hypothetical protein [Streptomyces turgidiscabies]